MRKPIKIYLGVIRGVVLALMSSISLSEEPIGQKNPPSYVNITLEIHGLEESVELLKEASYTLSEAMKELESQDMDTQDLARIERIAASMEEVSEKINNTLEDIGPAIRQARQPTVEFVSAIAQETREEAIDPVVSTVQDTVYSSVNQIKWSLTWVGLVFLMAVTVLGLFLFKALQQLNGVTSTIREAFEKGEFVFRIKEKPENQETPSE